MSYWFFFKDGFYYRRGFTDFFHCTKQITTIVAAVQMYAVDNAGNYPPSLEVLIPKYLPDLPVCMEKPKDSDTEKIFKAKYNFRYDGYGYEVSADHRNFTVYCRSNVHFILTPLSGHPSFNTRTGQHFNWREGR
jgi:hypothetical protein